MLTLEQTTFITYVNRVRPKSVGDLRPAYNPLFLGAGAYREAFDVRIARRSLDLVIKFPRDGRTDAIVEHALVEVRAIRGINRLPNMVALRRYMPEVLHHNRFTGVTVMPKYANIPSTLRHFVGFKDTFTNLLYDLMPDMKWEFDNKRDNFGLNEFGDYILLDAGLLETEHKF